MADEVKKETKDQRKARLNREGRAFLKSGDHHLITPQHQTAMDYFTRKRSNDDRRSRAEQSLGTGEPRTKKATGEVNLSGSSAQLPVPGAQRDKVFKKIAKQIRLRGEENPGSKYAGIATETAPRLRLNKLGAINEDDTHHSAMATIADHLSDKLEESEYHGILHSKDTTAIDSALTQAYKSLHESELAHNGGQVNDAKVHMESAHRNLYSAATQLKGKGVELHPALISGIKTTAEGYIKSTRPGEGAMPHPGFRPPKQRSATVRMDTEADEKKALAGALKKKVSGDPIESAQDTSWTEDSSDNSLNNVDDAVSMVGRQLKLYAPVPAGVPKGKK
jgi:hypothetical protein